jgi:hypothetical protein
VAWHRPIEGFRWSLRDVDHAGEASSPFGGAPGLAQRPAGAQVLDQLPPQAAAALHVKAAVDGFVAHPHSAMVGEQENEPPADLLGAVLGMQPILHVFAEPVVDREPARLGSPSTLIGQGLSHRRPVAGLAANGSAAQLSAHRRWRSTELPRDRTHTFTRRATASDLLPLPQGQAPLAHAGLVGRERLGHHTANVPEPPPGDSLRHADRRRGLGDHHPRPHGRPEPALDLHRNRRPTTNTHAAPQLIKVLR